MSPIPPDMEHLVDMQQLVRVEKAGRATAAACRRGSWFELPQNLQDARRKAHPTGRQRAYGLSMTMEEQKRIYEQETMPGKIAQARWEALGLNGGSDRTAFVKRDAYVVACDVVCMHCLVHAHFGKRFPVWAQHPTRAHFVEPTPTYNCESCGLPLWPGGGFYEAQVMRRLTGDFSGFNMMLQYPPTDLENTDHGTHPSR